MAEYRQLSDAEIEQTVDRLVGALDKGAARTFISECLGEEGFAAYRRCALCLYPALIRWQAGELNAGTDTADRMLALAAAAAWMMANDAKNTDDPEQAMDLSLSMLIVVSREFVAKATPVEGAELNASTPERTT